MTGTDQMLQPGGTAPPFALGDATGRVVSLREFAGRRVIVYFFPAAMTPGCTTEACDFRDHNAAVAGAGIALVGISRDTPERLAEFAARERLTFPLLTDADRQVHAAYGVLATKLVDGVPVEKVRRSTFVIGPDGVVQQARYDVRPEGHVAGLVEELVSGA